MAQRRLRHRAAMCNDAASAMSRVVISSAVHNTARARRRDQGTSGPPWPIVLPRPRRQVCPPPLASVGPAETVTSATSAGGAIERSRAELLAEPHREECVVYVLAIVGEGRAGSACFKAIASDGNMRALPIRDSMVARLALFLKRRSEMALG